MEQRSTATGLGDEPTRPRVAAVLTRAGAVLDLADALHEAGLTGRGGLPDAGLLRASFAHHAGVVVDTCDVAPSARHGWVVEHRLPQVVTGAALLGGHQPEAVRYAARAGGAAATRLRAAGLDVVEVPAHLTTPSATDLLAAAGRYDTAPTLVVDAETAWRVAQVDRYGPRWFRRFGTPEQPGPRLVTVHGHVAHPGVLATVAGASLAEVVAAAGPLTPGAAVLVGGVTGAVLAAATVRTVRWSDAALAAYGAGTGDALVEVLDPAVCPLTDLVTRLRRAAGYPDAAVHAGRVAPATFAAGVAELVSAAGSGARHARLSGYAASALRVHHDHLLQHVAGCPLGAAEPTTRLHDLTPV